MSYELSSRRAPKPLYTENMECHSFNRKLCAFSVIAEEKLKERNRNRACLVLGRFSRADRSKKSQKDAKMQGSLSKKERKKRRLGELRKDTKYPMHHVTSRKAISRGNITSNKREAKGRETKDCEWQPKKEEDIKVCPRCLIEKLRDPTKLVFPAFCDGTSQNTTSGRQKLHKKS